MLILALLCQTEKGEMFLFRIFGITPLALGLDIIPSPWVRSC